MIRVPGSAADRRRPAVQSQPMGFAYHGIARDAAQKVGDSTGRLALAPQAPQFFDPFVRPIHRSTYEM